MSGVIAALQPLLTAVAATYLIGEKLHKLQKLGLALGFCGIAIAISPKLLAASQADFASAAVPLSINFLAMLSVTYGTIYQKKYLQTCGLRIIATLQYVGALLVSLPLALAFERFHFNGLVSAVLSLLWSVFDLSMGAVGLLLYVIRKG